MKKRLISIFLTSIMLCVCVLPTAMAAEENSLSIYGASDEISAQFNTVSDFLSDSEVKENKNLEGNTFVKLESLDNGSEILTSFSNSNVPSTYANAQLDLGVEPNGNLTATLEQDQIHILLFQLTEDKVLFSKMTSNNSEYAFQIYSVGADGTLQAYSGAMLAGQELNGTIPAGQYAFVVANVGSTYGETYTLFMNTCTPVPSNAASINVLSISDSYQHVTVQVMDTAGKTILYCDGVEVFNENNPASLDWERVLDLSWSSGYNYNKHEIYNAKVSGISGIGTYVSDYVTSDNAVVLFLDVDTGYMYNESKRNWDTGESLFHFYDPFGNETPRLLDAYDIENYHCWLIFDLNSGKPIDFWSLLNWYYATGTEEASFTLNAN